MVGQALCGVINVFLVLVVLVNVDKLSIAVFVAILIGISAVGKVVELARLLEVVHLNFPCFCRSNNSHNLGLQLGYVQEAVDHNFGIVQSPLLIDAIALIP